MNVDAKSLDDLLQACERMVDWAWGERGWRAGHDTLRNAPMYLDDIRGAWLAIIKETKVSDDDFAGEYRQRMSRRVTGGVMSPLCQVLDHVSCLERAVHKGMAPFLTNRDDSPCQCECHSPEGTLAMLKRRIGR